MQTIPNEILDQVLGYVHPTSSSPSRVPTTCGAPLDTRHKSNHEPLLRGSTVHFATEPSSIYKELRTVFPSYYTRALFQTLYLYPHEQSLQKAIAISTSSSAGFVQRVVVHLPFFTAAFLRSQGDHYSEDGFWTKIPPNIINVLRRFPSLQAIIILPSWARKLDWLQRHGERYGELERAWRHYRYEHHSSQLANIGDSEYHDLENIGALLVGLRRLGSRVRHLHVFNLGTEWLPFFAAQGAPDPRDLIPLSPATMVNLELHAHHSITKLVVRSCALHDLVWFTPVFGCLEELHLEDISARHSGEVALFATTFDRHLFPKIRRATIKSSDLPPIDYVYIFTALQNHGRLIHVTFQNIHSYCPNSIIGTEFHFDSQDPKDTIQQDLCRYLRNEVEVTQFEASWVRMFRESGRSFLLFPTLDY